MRAYSIIFIYYGCVSNQKIISDSPLSKLSAIFYTLSGKIEWKIIGICLLQRILMDICSYSQT